MTKPMIRRLRWGGALMRERLRSVADRFEARLTPTRRAQRYEFAYWQNRHRLEGKLRNEWYVWAFTTYFGLPLEWYAGKRLLDVGCGPRGSLEWATHAAERVGVDPLADTYRALGTEQHQMRYVRASAERLPFPDGAFDVVSSFNSLDHGQDAETAAAELLRVCRPAESFSCWSR